MTKKLTASHWGVGVATIEEGQITDITGHGDDPCPSPINANIPSSLHGDARVRCPAVRASWLLSKRAGKQDKSQDQKQTARGKDSFVEVSWDEVLDLISEEVTRIKHTHGNQAIFAGSYGWSSAGRFHHAQSQLKRFLNTNGGFVRSEGNYSYNAALGLMPYVAGSYRTHVAEATRWSVIAQSSELVVMFGGMAVRNTQISDGGIHKHRMRDNLAACAANNVRFVNISPLRDDADKILQARWMPVIPGTDTALMMGLAHCLIEEGLVDEVFVATYTTGYAHLQAYLLGKQDGIVKDAAWAAALTGWAEDDIKALAKDMATKRTMITIAAGVQRADYGEQPLWMGIALAAMLGQIGLPGGGYGIGYGVNGNIGNAERPFRWGTMAQGTNDVTDFIPVAMISEMLLNPGGFYPYQGQMRQFPDIRLVWWAGGNPFHHHQDLNRLHKAFQMPETIIVNEVNWTSTARHADIVLPVAAPQERNDFCAGKSDNGLVPMPQLVPPVGQARTEFEIYEALSQRLGCYEAFTEGKSLQDWQEEIWDITRQRAKDHDIDLPEWAEFLQGDMISLPDPAPMRIFLQAFRDDPDTHSLPTPSGKIELYSEKIASFELADCKGHPYWFEPHEWTKKVKGEAPLALLSGQPKTRLHSQLDNGAYSLSHKIKGREPLIMHPDDAADRQLNDGDIIEVFNARGRCLAGLRTSDAIMKGVVFLWTGAWYDPDYNVAGHRDRHGNPNVLTHDKRSSSLTQSSAAHSAYVEVAAYQGPLDDITVHQQPHFRKDI